jgi:hypothetical protein
MPWIKPGIRACTIAQISRRLNRDTDRHDAMRCGFAPSMMFDTIFTWQIGVECTFPATVARIAAHFPENKND